MKLKSLLAVALVAGASSAMASDFYVAGSVGQSDVNINAPGGTKDESDTAYKLNLGWQFHKNFALEAGYFDLGKGKATFPGANYEFKADGWGVGIVGSLPLNDQWSVFGRVAAVDVKVKQSCSGALCPAGASADSTNWNGNYGLGVQWNFTKQVGVRAEYERFDKVGGTSASSKYDVDVWSLGVVVKF